VLVVAAANGVRRRSIPLDLGQPQFFCWFSFVKADQVQEEDKRSAARLEREEVAAVEAVIDGSRRGSRGALKIKGEKQNKIITHILLITTGAQGHREALEN